MRRIVWSGRGARLFETKVVDFVAARDEAAARRLRHAIDRALLLLAQRPIVPWHPYIIAYSFRRRDNGDQDELVVLRVIHTFRHWAT